MPKSALTAPLSHPPFTFKAANNGAQTLKAIGYINGKKAAEHIVIRPEKPSGIRLRAQSNAPLSANGSDAAREMPAFASSCADGIDAAFGNDGNPARSWRPADTDAAPYWYVDMQTTQSISTLEISWNESEPHRFFVEVAQDTDSWSIVTEYRSDASEFGTRLPLEASGRYLRIRFTDKTSGFSMLYAYKK